MDDPEILPQCMKEAKGGEPFVATTLYCGHLWFRGVVLGSMLLTSHFKV